MSAVRPFDWAGRRVFVTGATGIVGSWLTKALLAAGSDVAALVRDHDLQSELYRSGAAERIRIFSGRLEDMDTLERAILEHEADTVFHLAAQPIVSVALRAPLQTFEANIRGTYHLLEACRRSGYPERVVVASSDKAYGTHEDLPYDEEMPLQGRFPYDVSKSCTDLLARSYYEAYDLPVTIARCGNIYGGGDLNWTRIVPGTIRSLLRGESPLIRSDGTFVRDYIYVKDVAAAYMLLAERLDAPAVVGEAFNFSPEEPRTVLDVVDVIRRRMGREHIEPTVLATARAEIRAQHLSAAKAREILGWTLEYGMDDAIDETIRWYEDFLDDAVRRAGTPDGNGAGEAA